MVESKYNKIIDKPRKNIALLWEGHPMLVLGGAILTTVIIGTTIYAAYLLTQGNVNSASTYTNISSSLATILLAALTGVYVVSIKDENRKNREHREDFYKEKRNNEKHKIRIALKSEIKNMDSIRTWKKRDTEGSLPTTNFVSTTVYDSNSDKIGLLTAAETQAIVELYSFIHIVEGIINNYQQAYFSGEKDQIGDEEVSEINNKMDELENTRKNALRQINNNL